MTYVEVQAEIAKGFVVTRSAWDERGYQLGRAYAPTLGAPTLLLAQGTSCWTGWTPQADDEEADDWKLAGEKRAPVSFMSGLRGGREVP